MSGLQILAVLAVGLAAGTINTVVGSGSLITFPTLLAIGYPALIANVSNTVGLVPGSMSGVIAYRRELAGQARRLALLGVMAIAGGTAGALLLLQLPGTVFRRVVPALILLACVLVAVQPWLSGVLARRGERRVHGGIGLSAAALVTAVYGGYFGAAQGVILISLLGIFVDDDLQRLNATKNVLALLTNGAAALVFIAASRVSWEAAGCIAAGSIIGGQLGGSIGRRIPPKLLRALIICVGLIVSISLLV